MTTAAGRARKRGAPAQADPAPPRTSEADGRPGQRLRRPGDRRGPADHGVHGGRGLGNGEQRPRRDRPVLRRRRLHRGDRPEVDPPGGGRPPVRGGPRGGGAPPPAPPATPPPPRGGRGG